MNNSGTFLAQNNTGLTAAGSGNAFNNSGTFTRNIGTGTYTTGSGIAFNNSGAVNVQSGALELDGGGTGTGSFAISSGATLNFAAGTYDLNAGSTLSGAGTMQVSGPGRLNFNAGSLNLTGTMSISGGEANFNAAASTAQLVLSGGNLSGSAALTVSGLFTWNGGTLSGTGVTNANGGILMDGTLALDQRTLNNAAGQTATQAATLNNDANLVFSNGATFNNHGTFLAKGNDSDGFFDGGGGDSTFNNTGTFTRTTGTDVFTIHNGIIFNNSGTVNVKSGTLSFDGGYVQTAGRLDLAGGNVESSTGLQIQGGALTGIGMITSAITNSALLRPSLGVGGLSVTGNVSLLAASNLSFQLGGLTQGTQYGFLNVNGTVGLGGQLVVSFVNGFQNSVNGTDTFTVLNSAFTLNGSFSNVASGMRLATSDGFGSFLVTYNGKKIVLSDFHGTPVLVSADSAAANDIDESRRSPLRKTRVSGVHVASGDGAANTLISRTPNLRSRTLRPAPRSLSSGAGRRTGSRVVLNVSNSAQLLSLLDEVRPGPGGKLILPVTAPAVNAAGGPSRLQVDRGASAARLLSRQPTMRAGGAPSRQID